MPEQCEEQAKICLNKDGDDEAFSCLLNVLENLTGKEKCPPGFVLLFQDNCESCEAEMRRLKASIDKGLIKPVHINTPEGLALVKNNDIAATPSLLFVDCHGKVIDPV